MQPFVAFDHVQLAMPHGEEERARAFYVDVLGMTTVPKPPDLAARGGLWFASGSLALHLGVDPNFVPAAKAHVALRCRDYAGMVARLKSAGYGVIPAGTFEDGLEHAFLADPFGNRIELVSAPPAL